LLTWLNQIAKVKTIFDILPFCAQDLKENFEECDNWVIFIWWKSRKTFLRTMKQRLSNSNLLQFLIRSHSTYLNLLGASKYVLNLVRVKKANDWVWVCCIWSNFFGSPFWYSALSTQTFQIWIFYFDLFKKGLLLKRLTLSHLTFSNLTFWFRITRGLSVQTYQ